MKQDRSSIDDPRVRRSINRILQGTELCSMATVRRDQVAHINTADFAYSRDYELCFISYPESRHAQNLIRNRSMAVTVYDSTQRWGRPHRGLQFFGTAREEKNPKQLRRIEKWYAKRFRGYTKWKNEVESESGRFPLRFYRFTPSLVKVFDEKEFGEQTLVRVQL